MKNLTVVSELPSTNPAAPDRLATSFGIFDDKRKINVAKVEVFTATGWMSVRDQLEARLKIDTSDYEKKRRIYERLSNSSSDEIQELACDMLALLDQLK